MMYVGYMEHAKTVRELRDTLGKSVDAAFYGARTTLVTKNGEPRAALVPIDVLRAAREVVRGWNNGGWRVGPDGDLALEELAEALAGA